MKKFLLPLILFFILGSAQVSTFPWTESFEDASPTVGQWTYEYISGTNTSATNNVFWTIRTSPSVGYTSSTAAYAGAKMLDFDPRSFSAHSGRYISPILNLSSITNPTLDFFYRNQVWGSDQNQLKIYYRISATDAWTLISTLNTNVPTWANSGPIALPNPSATYQIALVGVAAYGYAITIDELKVGPGTLAVSEVGSVKNVAKMYPNPTSDVLSIESKELISRYSISDFGGKNLKSDIVNSKDFKIDVRDLSSGGYIIILEDKNGNKSTQKFIKK